VVGLKPIAMADSADALKIFAAIWIAGMQSSDECAGHFRSTRLERTRLLGARTRGEPKES
jgi:hypothetical protein